MIELPESAVLSAQITDQLHAKTIASTIAAQSPHKFAWYHGDPAAYQTLLKGRTIDHAHPVGSRIQIELDGAVIRFFEGVNLRYHEDPATWPNKHQLLLHFTDGSALSATVSMYGGLYASTGPDDEENAYYAAARDKPSPLTDAFDEKYFDRLIEAAPKNLSAKAVLATEQRIPGLGNGVLQDILFEAGIHPMRRISALNDDDLARMYGCVKGVLTAMTASGGRDTERDLYGQRGKYPTLRNRALCPRCGTAILNRSFLGGKIYYCLTCQSE